MTQQQHKNDYTKKNSHIYIKPWLDTISNKICCLVHQASYMCRTLVSSDFIRHWCIRVLPFFLIDSCHGNKLEHRHFVRRFFFSSAQSFQMFSLPAGIMLSEDICLTFLDVEMRTVDRIKKVKRPMF